MNEWTNSMTESINQWLNKWIIRDDIKPAPKVPGMDPNTRVPDQVIKGSVH